ncbi:hypothetical protein BASA60_001984 [Batrachochytrium salamandrivorans]|nr:hypothetical protein BASA60_001984 [Batrachochytrium salamandrivorans]
MTTMMMSLTTAVVNIPSIGTKSHSSTTLSDTAVAKEYLAEQSCLRKVYDADSGRTRTYGVSVHDSLSISVRAQLLWESWMKRPHFEYLIGWFTDAISSSACIPRLPNEIIRNVASFIPGLSTAADARTRYAQAIYEQTHSIGPAISDDVFERVFDIMDPSGYDSDHDPDDLDN